MVYRDRAACAVLCVLAAGLLLPAEADDPLVPRKMPPPNPITLTGRVPK